MARRAAVAARRAAGVTRLSDKEQRYASYGVVWAALWSVVLWAPSFDEKAAVALAGIGLAMAFLLAVAARRRQRLFTGLACILLAFGPWGMAWVLGLPFLLLAAWLALKSNRLRPVAEPELDENGEMVERPVVPARVRPARTSRRRRNAAEGDDPAPDGSTGAPRTRPPPSKRYTPPQGPR